VRAAFERLPVGAIDQSLITRYIRVVLADGLSESSVKARLVPLCGMLTDAVTDGLTPQNPLRAPNHGRGRGGAAPVIAQASRRDGRAPPLRCERDQGGLARVSVTTRLAELTDTRGGGTVLESVGPHRDASDFATSHPRHEESIRTAA
jgi:hypothetical protein